MEQMTEFRRVLREEEKSALTVEKYCRDAETFLTWSGGRSLTKALVIEYKKWLLEHFAPASINSMLSGLNRYLTFLGREDCRVRSVKLQQDAFSSPERELSVGEYRRLLRAASGKPWLWLLLQTICATGIRVSELRYITVEAAKAGSVSVSCKGKLRTVLLPRKLCQALRRYATKEGIHTGSIFVTSHGNVLDRSRIWSEMKKLCDRAEVDREKVFPHNLRHLFARIFYSMEKDIVRLADILGHSNINTTRIYTRESGEAHRKQLEKMPLLCIT